VRSAHQHTRLWGGPLVPFTFWGWQIVILLAAITLPLGITSGKEYAELEWPIDILITLVWVSYALVFFGTIAQAQGFPYLCGNWFFGAFIIAVALLHIVNSMAVPVTLTKSYSAYCRRAGCDDSVVVWSQRGRFLPDGRLPGHDVLLCAEAGWPSGLFLSPVRGPLLGADLHLHVGGPAPPALHRPAGLDPVGRYGLLADSAGSVWGGMINGIMTLSGAWHKLRDDPILKFLITSLSFYGMSTFEGPMMSIKTVNALSHYTDWTVGHVHSGALGWVAMVSIGSIYYLLPKLFGKTEMYSTKLVTTHFWIATIGTVLYIASMWIAGVMQGLMWRAVNADGTLAYSFVESVKGSYPFWAIRWLGGVLFLSGMLIMAYNMFKTMAGGKTQDACRWLVPAGHHA
jgi:cytochrome c oxidase cbb3-type subunit 1